MPRHRRGTGPPDTQHPPTPGRCPAPFPGRGGGRGRSRTIPTVPRRLSAGAIGRISEIIGSINDFQLTIASAVEEQTATTNEMSRSVQEAAGGSTEIATNITGVSAAASSTTQSLGQTRQAVDELSRMASDLRRSVATFTW